MMLIREFERVLVARPDAGFQLLSTGQEAVAVGVAGAMVQGDMLLTSGRSIGPALARGVSASSLLAELLGRRTGPCKGLAGRGHVAAPDLGFFGAHAVVGGNLTVAVGVALALQMTGSGRAAVCIFGDGACGEGALHESLNIAKLWKVPLLFVVDNNQYAVSTRQRDGLAPLHLADLGQPFGIPATTVDGMDLLEVRAAASAGLEALRAGEGPALLECISYRFTPHSTSSRECRPAEEIEAWRRRCPIAALTGSLRERGDLTDEALAELGRSVEEEVAAAVRLAESSEPLRLEELLELV